MQQALSAQRVLSIDALRGITIWVMIFVNELSGVTGIPWWMKHMPADADAMTFVDVVFPAFLFIVGMSIPFAINTRKIKGDTPFEIQKHILFRSIGLLVLGVFMVNAEGGYDEATMRIPISLWSLLFYGAVILVWKVYSKPKEALSIALRVVGVGMLIVIAFLYTGSDGIHHITPQWWGILGLIGWAYLFSCMLYQVVKGNITAMVILILLCMGYYGLGRSLVVQSSGSTFLKVALSEGGIATLIAIVLCGLLLSLLFFYQEGKTIARRFVEATVLVAALCILGFTLRPYFHISKIYATPTWALYSSALCSILFMFLFWLIDIKKVSRWTLFFKPAAANPLLTYIIPFIVYALMQYFSVSFPQVMYEGVTGMVWCAVYATLVMGFVSLLNRMKFRLQL